MSNGTESQWVQLWVAETESHEAHKMKSAEYSAHGDWRRDLVWIADAGVLVESPYSYVE